MVQTYTQNKTHFLRRRSEKTETSFKLDPDPGHRHQQVLGHCHKVWMSQREHRLWMPQFQQQQEDLPPPRKVVVLQRTPASRQSVCDLELENQRLKNQITQKDWHIKILTFLLRHKRVDHPWVWLNIEDRGKLIRSSCKL